jgi:WD40 repeat protein/tetratricopeptide (TPR) repeat protein
VAFSPDGKTILTGSDDRTARLWDVATGRPIGEPLKHQGMVWAVAFSPDGQTVLTGGWDKTARLWDAATGRPIGRPLVHRGVVAAVAFSPDGRAILTGSHDGTARLWETIARQPVGLPLEHQGQGWVAAVAFSPDGQTVLTGGMDGMARLWDPASGRPIGDPLGHRGGVWDAAFSPDGRAILTGSRDGTARLWDAATGRPIGDPLTHRGEVLAVAFSPDGRAILTGSQDGTVQLWDTHTAESIGPPLRHENRVWAVAFSPDGRAILTGSQDGTARLWDAATGRPIGDPLTHQGWVVAVAFSPDGQTVLTGGADGKARLWDFATGRPIGKPLEHQEAVWAVAFSPDGKTVLTGGWGGTARLWDAATGQPIDWPLEHQERVLAVAFSPDGNTLLTGSGDGKARLWECPARLPDDIPRLAAWVETRTGLELDKERSVRILDNAAWRRRCERLGQLGGPPARTIRVLDPVLFGPQPTARARAWMERKRWGEAEAAFDEAVQARPLDSSIWLERGSFFASRGRAERAAADFAQALRLIPPDRNWQSSHSRMILDLPRWGEAYAKLLELKPDDGDLWIGRGRYNALRSRWDQAAADFARGISSAPPDSEEWFEYACLRLIVGDRAAYRTLVREMQRKQGRTDDRFMAYILARSCSLASDPVVAPETIIRWAEKAVASDSNPWFLHSLGAAHYRADHLDEAISRLEESNAGGWSQGGKAQNRLLLAMAHHRLGHVMQARAILDEVRTWWGAALATEAEGPVAMPTTDWLPLQLLRREAEALILFDPVFPDDPFARRAN